VAVYQVERSCTLWSCHFGILPSGWRRLGTLTRDLHQTITPLYPLYDLPVRCQSSLWIFTMDSNEAAQPPLPYLSSLYNMLLRCPKRHNLSSTQLGSYYLTVRRFYELILRFSLYIHLAILRDEPFFPLSENTQKAKHVSDIRVAYSDICRVWELAIAWLREIPLDWYYGKSSLYALNDLFLLHEISRTQAWRESTDSWAYLKATYDWGNLIHERDYIPKRIDHLIVTAWNRDSPRLNFAAEPALRHCTEILHQRCAYNETQLELSPLLHRDASSFSFLEIYLRHFGDDRTGVEAVVEMLCAFTEFIVNLLDYSVQRQSWEGQEPEYKWYNLGFQYARRRFALYASKSACALPRRIRGKLTAKDFHFIWDPLWHTALKERDKIPLERGQINRLAYFDVLCKAMTSERDENMHPRGPIVTVLAPSSLKNTVNPDPDGIHTKSWPVPSYPSSDTRCFEMINQSQFMPRPEIDGLHPKEPPRRSTWCPTPTEFSHWWKYNMSGAGSQPVTYGPTTVLRPLCPSGPAIRLCDFATPRFVDSGFCSTCQENLELVYQIWACGHSFHWKCLLSRVNGTVAERMVCPICGTIMFHITRALRYREHPENVLTDTVI
jgi:hypothetical protein